MEGGTTPGRKVVVVGEPTSESAAALQYALSHTLVEDNKLTLIHVENPSSWRNTFFFLRRPILSSISFPISPLHIRRCFTKKSQCPQNITLETYGNLPFKKTFEDRKTTLFWSNFLLQCNTLLLAVQYSASVCINGSRRPGGSMKGIDTAEYLIEKCKCTCVGVQKNLKRKTQKNFW
ncbi:LOW QUALITY PROTEIN: hypothetical protein CFOL_v3_05728, partial [Cephalotus follicularis]